MAKPKPGDGLHLICAAYCRRSLSDAAAVEMFIRRAVEATGLHLRHLHIQRFSNGHLRWWEHLLGRKHPPTTFGPGITGIGILSESHIAVHTTPESNYLYADLFSCKSFDTLLVAQIINDIFQVTEWTEWQLLRR